MNPLNLTPGGEFEEKGKGGEPAAPQKSGLSSSFGYILSAIGLALIIRFFIAAPYVVSGASMEPTFHDWHYLIVDKLVYEVSAPQRGDVIVFKMPKEESRSLIKRIIGLPGETVIIVGPTVTIINEQYPDGLVLDEPYIDPTNVSYNDHVKTTLGPNEYFVLGDNRRVSSDSRVWGALPKEDFTGRVDIRLFPLNEFGLLPGEVRYDETGKGAISS